MRRWIVPRADLDGPPRPLPGAGRVAGQQALVGAGDCDPGMRRRLVPAVEQPVRPRQPAPHRRHEGGVDEQVHRDASGSTGRRGLLPGEEARRVSALPGLDGHVEVAGRIGDLAERR
jgi:hypothetical protein